MLPHSNTASLFDETGPDPGPDTAQAGALSVRPPTLSPLSPAAKAFNQQLARIDKLKSQLQALDALGQAHREALHQNVTPLHKRHAQCMREMALWLEQRMAGKALSTLQRQTAREILCDLARTLAQLGQADMAELHDRHSPRSLDQLAQDRADALRAELEAALGDPLDAAHDGANAEELLRAGMERLRQSVNKEQERRREAAQARKARKQPSAAQGKAQALLEDAATTLRQLFRQLASALHPDREPDAAARLRKTSLMSEANAAYGRKDLVALMQIQQRAALADADAASRLSDDRLAALTLLLKQQVADLERERVGRNDQLAVEFDIPFGLGVTPKTLQMVLHEQVFELEEMITQMECDLMIVQADAGLKRWLTQQRHAIKRTHLDADMDGYF